MADVDRTFREGGKGYGHYKMQLLDLFHAKFDGARAKRKELEADPAFVESVLQKGASKARDYAAPVMDQVRRAVGLR
jgi:tryptophanyl-tRNA synthetase